MWKNWTLPEDGWSTKYHCGIVTDGLGRVYFSNEWYKGADLPLGKRQGNKAHLLWMDTTISEAVPIPGTGRITMIHAVSGRGGWKNACWNWTWTPGGAELPLRPVWAKS